MASLKELKKARSQKVEELKKKGISAYPDSVGKFQSIDSVLRSFGELEKSAAEVFVVGRIMLMRVQGGLIFGQIQDGSGKIQFFLSKKDIGEEQFSLFKKSLELGDILKIGGKVFKTRRGEKTISVSQFLILSKALRPLPEKWHGLQDVEKRLRHRYLDLLLNKETRDIFLQKAAFGTLLENF